MQGLTLKAFNKYGDLVSGVQAYVYIHGTTTQAPVYSGNGTGLLVQPITSDSEGDYDFFVANGLYDHVTVATTDVPAVTTTFTAYDFNNPAQDAVAAASSSGIITIGPSNCAFTTIQAALNANPVVNALFQVSPGTYTNDTINFTANGQCVVGMGTTSQQIINQVSGTICTVGAFTNCRLSNLTLTISGATTAVTCVSVSTGTMEISEVDMNVTNASVSGATQPSFISISSTGTVGLEFGDMVYTNTVTDGNGVTAIKSALLLGNGTVETEGVDITMTCSGQSAGSTIAYTAGSGYLITTGSNEFNITDTGGTVVAGYFSAGTGTLAEIANSDWTITGGGANSCIGIYLSVSATVRSHDNDFLITGGLTNYSCNLAAGATLNSGMDVFTAASGKTGAGTFNYVTTDAAGSLMVSGGLVGTATNNNAPAGDVGEYVTSSVVSTTVNLSTGTTASVTSIQLTAGDWDVSGAGLFQTATTTSVTAAIAGISTTNNTLGADGTYARSTFAAVVPGAVEWADFLTPIVRLSLSTTTTVYLVVQSTFTASTQTAGGTIRARRVR